MFTPFDTACMARALQLARRGWYTARPNPRVGCVIAKDGKVVAEGFHRRAGEPHAEINALAAAGAAARGATAYVTLEPCNHQGRTGPCSRALMEAGVAEVVYGTADPHGVAAGGNDVLREGGVAVRGPLLETEARAMNPGFFQRCLTGLPRVTVKVAMSLDGRTAMASGESQWITGPAARRDVQRLRAQSDAVITGIGTVLADDPALTVRAGELDEPDADAIAEHQPLRVVVDSRGRTPADARLLAQPGPVLLARATDAAPAPSGVESVQLGAGRVDLKELLLELGRRGLNEILVEAGPELAGAFVAAGLCDRLVIYTAPKLLGSQGRPMLVLPLERMAEAESLTILDSRAVGDDWRTIAKPERD